MSIERKVLEDISKSSLYEFKTSLEWAQWCRNMAHAALADDDEEADELIQYRRSAVTSQDKGG